MKKWATDIQPNKLIKQLKVLALFSVQVFTSLLSASYNYSVNKISNIYCYYNDSSIKPDFLHFTAEIEDQTLAMKNAMYMLVSPYPPPQINIPFLKIDSVQLNADYTNPDFLKYSLIESETLKSNYQFLLPRNYSNLINFIAYIFKSPEENENTATAFNCYIN